jgi:hypothetical protein
MPVSPQDAPIVTSLTGRKLFVTSDTLGADEGNIDPLDLPIATSTQTALDDRLSVEATTELTSTRRANLAAQWPEAITNLVKSEYTNTLPKLAHLALPNIISSEVLLSSADGDFNYNAWPVVKYDQKRDCLVAVWVSSHSHAGINEGRTMFSRSLDGIDAKSWTTPAVIVDVTGEPGRDAVIDIFDDRYILTNIEYASWAGGALGATSHYESFDAGGTWVKIAQTDGSGATFEGRTWQKAAFTSDIIVCGNGLLLQSGFETIDISGDTSLRSVLWQSVDNARTWTIRSEVMPAVITAGDFDDYVDKPNETQIIFIEGKLVAFVRNEGDASRPKLLRFESDDEGLTWGSEHEVDISAWGNAKPWPRLLPDGRLTLTGRRNRTSQNANGAIYISMNAGLTFSDQILSLDRNEQSTITNQYVSIVVISDSEAVVVMGGDTTTNEISIITSFKLDIDQNNFYPKAPPLLDYLKVSFDASNIRGSAATGYDGEHTWAASATPPTPYFDQYFNGRKTALFAVDEYFDIGAVGDYPFLYDGNPFTVAFSFKMTTESATASYLLSQGSSSAGRRGLSIYTTTGRVNFSISDGSSMLVNKSGGGVGPIYNFREWNNFVLTFDGTTYSMFLNGRLQDTEPAGTGYAGGDSHNQLSIGAVDNASDNGDPVNIRRVAIWETALTSDQARESGRWIMK